MSITFNKKRSLAHIMKKMLRVGKTESWCIGTVYIIFYALLFMFEIFHNLKTQTCIY